MTASGGNLIRGEIHRNERAPQCGVAKIEEAENKMNTNTRELNMDEMEMVNGGFSVWGAIAGAIYGGAVGATGGGCVGGPVGGVIGGVIGGIAGGIVGGTAD